MADIRIFTRIPEELNEKIIIRKKNTGIKKEQQFKEALTEYFGVKS
jgi:hypothetical protein